MRNLLRNLLTSLATATVITAQVPCTSANLGTDLLLADETMSPPQPLGFTFVYNGVGYTDIQVCDNGYVTLGATGGVANWNVQEATLRNDPFPRICPMWADLEPNVPGSGSVYFRAVPAAGSTPAYAIITWDSVWQYFGTTPHTFQLFLIAGGQFRVHYGADVAQNPGSVAWLVGASPGNGAAPNGVAFTSLPIATMGSATLHENGNGPLALASSTLDFVPDGTGGYQVVEIATCSSATSRGVGCLASFASFYEHFATSPSIDLSNTSFTLRTVGAARTIAPSTVALQAPSAGAQNLALLDDSEATVQLSAGFPYGGGVTTTLNVHSNGILSTASNGALPRFRPNPPEFLAFPNPSWVVWHDLIPDTTNNVWFEEAGGIAYVTWLNVLSYEGTTPGVTGSTFQVQFELGSGDVHFVFQGLDTTSVNTWPMGDGWVVGYTPGQGADPGSIDLSTSLPRSLPTTDLLPLRLTASACPVIGTTIGMITKNIANSALFGGVMFGLVLHDPGIDLTPQGMPGCFQYTDTVYTVLFSPMGNSLFSVPFPVPNSIGLQVVAQSFLYAPNAAFTTPFGATSSNALLMLLGH